MQSDGVADNFFLQQLNLFEIAARFRREKAFAEAIFGSWVIWFHDVHNSWWFRARWNEDYRDNYTKDLREIFDDPVKNYDPAAAPIQRKRAFFAHASKVFNCPVILKWLDN